MLPPWFMPWYVHVVIETVLFQGICQLNGVMPKRMSKRNLLLAFIETRTNSCSIAEIYHFEKGEEWIINIITIIDCCFLDMRKSPMIMEW